MHSFSLLCALMTMYHWCVRAETCPQELLSRAGHAWASFSFLYLWLRLHLNSLQKLHCSNMRTNCLGNVLSDDVLSIRKADSSWFKYLLWILSRQYLIPPFFFFLDYFMSIYWVEKVIEQMRETFHREVRYGVIGYICITESQNG